MQTFITSAVASLLFALILIPSTSHAYETTKQTAVRLSDSTLMYLVTYRFGHEDFAYHMPIVAKRDTKSENALTYNILANGKLRTNTGDSVGIVIADAPVEAGKYVVGAGEAKEFTLITFLTLPEDRVATSTYALKVAALPFEIVSDKGVVANQLNEGELTKYMTAPIGTDKKIGITTK